MNWKTSDEVAEYFSKFDTGFNAKEFKTELKNAIDAVVKNCNIPHVSGSLACPNCGAELQLEVKEMTNSDILKALKANDR